MFLNGNTNIFAFHIFAINIFVHPWIHSAGRFGPAGTVHFSYVITFKVDQKLGSINQNAKTIENRIRIKAMVA